jgi:hypothetical protein
VKIAFSFIGTSMVSRVMRSTELRVLSVEPDDMALRFIREAPTTPVRIIANRPNSSLHTVSPAIRTHSSHGTADERAGRVRALNRRSTYNTGGLFQYPTFLSKARNV